MIELNLLKFRVFKTPRQPWIFPKYQSHRGYWYDGIQENTLASLKMAKEKGFQMAEFDVQLSRDLVPVLIHDTDLQRLRKSASQICDLSASDLKRQADIPTLEEVLLSKDRPEYLNIELKTNHILDPRLEILVAQVIEKTCMHPKIIFSSFNPMTIVKLKKLLPSVPCGWLISPDREPGNWIFIRRLWISPILPFDYLNLHHSVVTDELLDIAQTAEIPVVVWTVNDKAQCESLLDRGVSSVITDQVFPVSE